MNQYEPPRDVYLKKYKEGYITPKGKLPAGWLYILMDTASPEYFRIGYTTNVRQMINGYTSKRPLPTIRICAISAQLSNACKSKSALRQYLTKKAGFAPTQPAGDWFSKEAYTSAIYGIEYLEGKYPMQ